jgi:uncharacterized protein (DUF2336 family)
MIEHLTQELVDAQAENAALREEVAEAWAENAALREEVAEAWAEICDNPDIKQGDPGELRIGVREACDAAYAQGGEVVANAQDALRAYLVAQGHSANPVTMPGPLGVLCDVLL